MIPGGRIDMMGDSKTALERELKEDLFLELKCILEMIIGEKYHEIGFYYIPKSDEMIISNNIKNREYKNEGYKHLVYKTKAIENYKLGVIL